MYPVFVFFQVLNGLDVLLKNDLGAVKQQFVAQSITGVYKNLTVEQFRRFARDDKPDRLFIFKLFLCNYLIVFLIL